MKVLLALQLTLCAAQLEQLLDVPASVMHVSLERWNEISAAKEDQVTSTGRVLSSTGRPHDRLPELLQWAEAPLPTRTRDYHNHHFNSDKWDLFEQRPGDVVIATAYKSGTTWMQGILANLILGETPANLANDISPWVDMRVPPPAAVKPALDGQTHRRFLKSHLPLDGLPYSETTKYIMLTRDLRDVAYSWYSHLKTVKQSGTWDLFDTIPGRFGDPIERGPLKRTARELFLDMIDNQSDGAKSEVWSYFHHLGTWWMYRHLPNMLLIHYADMKKDPKMVIRQVAEFLDIDATPELIDTVAENTSFDRMKAEESKILGPGLSETFKTGESGFFNKVA